MIPIPVRLQRLCVLTAALVLAACGGGGGGGGGSDGVPDAPRAPDPGGFTISTNSVALAAKINGPVPSQHIAVHLTDASAAQVVAGYRNGVTPASWLNVAAGGSGFDYQITLSVQTTGLAAAAYSTTLTIATQDSAGNTLQAKDVQIAYTLREGLAIVTSAFVSGSNGSSVQSVQTHPFTVTGPANVQWSSSSNVAWLSGPTGTQQGPGVFTLTANISGVPNGRNVGQLTITNVADPTDHAELLVTADIAPATLSVSASQLRLGGASGSELDPLPITFSLNTEQNAHPWTVETSPGSNWLRASLNSGTVDGSGATINIDADRSQLASGVYSGTVTLRANVNGQVIAKPIAVTLNYDSNHLVVSAAGVAFSSLPSRQVTRRELRVFNSWGRDGVRWNAASDQSWLSATASGTSADPLVLSADTTGLAPGQYLANVTISSPDATVSNQQSVRVGLIVGTVDPVASIDFGSTSADLVAGPVEPLLFVGIGPSIRVYDVNSGTLLRTLSGTFGDVQALTISDDGLRLFVVEEEAGSDPLLRILDPVSGAVQDTYQMTLPSFTSLNEHSLQYARPDGHPVLLSAGRSQDAFDLATGTRSFFAVTGPAISVSGDQGHVYAQNTGFSPSTITAYRLRYSALPGVGMTIDRLAENDGLELGVRSNGQDVAISPDGTHLYVAAGAPYQFDVLDAPSLVYSTSLAGEAFPTNVEACWNGLVAAGANDFDPAADIWFYNAGGTLRGRAGSGAIFLEKRALIFSGDCTRVISVNGTGTRIQSAPVP